MSTEPPVFPFGALCGQSDLQQVLLLLAVDPRIGGVLLSGPRGMAKTTSARALAAILPEGDFVNLPLGADEEQLIGSLDLDTALQHQRVVFRPGLLARADGGVLYIDEVNLLADTLVDQLLDVSASGVNRVERDGVSHSHPARLALVGSMNPEEGQLRPQLLDRFGLFLQLRDEVSPRERQQIVRRRLAFDEDPEAFAREYAGAQQQLRETVRSARARLGEIAFADADYERVSALCFEAAVEGVRADLVMLRAARAQAALQGRAAIHEADIETVAPWVLAHRRQAPADTPPPPTGQGPEPEQPQETPASSAEPAPGEGEARERDAANDWGAMPAQPVAPAAVKSVRPLSAKKP